LAYLEGRRGFEGGLLFRRRFLRTFGEDSFKINATVLSRSAAESVFTLTDFIFFATLRGTHSSAILKLTLSQYILWRCKSKLDAYKFLGFHSNRTSSLPSFVFLCPLMVEEKMITCSRILTILRLFLRMPASKRESLLSSRFAKWFSTFTMDFSSKKSYILGRKNWRRVGIWHTCGNFRLGLKNKLSNYLTY